MKEIRYEIMGPLRAFVLFLLGNEKEKYGKEVK